MLILQASCAKIFQNQLSHDFKMLNSEIWATTCSLKRCWSNSTDKQTYTWTDVPCSGRKIISSDEADANPLQELCSMTTPLAPTKVYFVVAKKSKQPEIQFTGGIIACTWAECSTSAAKSVNLKIQLPSHRASAKGHMY